MNAFAKILKTGEGQSVQLPTGFGFDADEVRVRRDGDCIVLEPVDADDRAWAERIAGSFDEDFARSVEEGRLGFEHLPEGPKFD